MLNPESDAVNLDTQCFEAALYEWNVSHTGSELTSVHLAWWKLSWDEKSAIMARASELKREILKSREVPA